MSRVKPLFCFFLSALYIVSMLLTACSDEAGEGSSLVVCAHDFQSDRDLFRPETSEIELTMIRMGLVDVQKLDPTIFVDLKYSDTANFLKKDVYGSFEKAYLQPDVAARLVRAQQWLRQMHPGLSLLVYDAARPVSVQKIIWESLDVPAGERGKFASNPRNGSLHNFGAAVDLTICDSTGRALDMGCPFDYFGELAWPVKEWEMIGSGLLTPTQVENRKLLRQVMAASGFYNIQTEWWHFNACTCDAARQRYVIIP